MSSAGTQLSVRRISAAGGILVAAACIMALPWTSTPTATAQTPGADARTDQELQAQILEGRDLVIQHACGGCHGGGDNPAAEGWLVDRQPRLAR